MSGGAVLLTPTLQADVRKLLAKAEAALFPESALSSSIAATAFLDGSSPETSFAAYSSCTADVDKIAFLARGKTGFRAEALVLLAAACNDGRNHAALCAKGLPELLCEEMARMASPLLPVCVTATAALAAQQTNREALRTAGVVNALVLVLCNPAATHLRELVLRALAMLCTNSSAVAAELVRAGAISALANIVRQLLPNVAVQPDSPLLTNSLWTLATVSCSPESHLPILKEGLIDMLVAVLERAASTTYCDYALSCLLQLTANEACRQLMVTFKAHDVLVVRIACSFPSIVRRSLQVLANLCVDESSRATISSVPRLFETVITSSKRFAPELIAAGQADARSLLQCLKLLSNIIQTEHESNLFRAARGVQWLVNLATQYESAPADATIEQQLGHLIANTLIHCDNQDDWVSLSGVAVLKSMLAESKAMPVRREAARAVSNLVALHDELRDAVYNAGIVSSFISSLRKSLAEQNAASQLQLQLFTLRALATLALSHHRTTELVGTGILDVVSSVVVGATASGGNPDEISGVVTLAIALLSNMAGSFELARPGDVRNSLVTHSHIGVSWVHAQVKSRDRTLQFQALKYFVQLAATWRGREWLHTHQVDTQTLGGDGGKPAKHLRHYNRLLSDVASFSHDITAKMPESEVPRIARRESRAVQMQSRRARHRAVMITADQLKTLSQGNMPEDAHGAVPEPSAMRFTLLSEFLASERRYASCLSLVRWKFERPLLGLQPNPPRGMISSVMVRMLFSPIEAVSEITNSFLDVLENRARESEQHALVGDAFLQLAQRIGAYVKYSEAFPQAISALTDTQRKSPALAAFFERTEKSPYLGGRTLRTLLEMPLDRPRAYIGFLTEYAAATIDSHPDRRELCEALEMIRMGSSNIRKHDPSDLERIIAIEQRIKGHFETLVLPGRSFVLEARAVLLQIGDKPLDAPFDVVVFVFSDLLVITKVCKQDRVKMLDRIPLSEVIVGSAEDEQQQPGQPAFPATSYKIQRCTVGSTLHSGYIVSAPSVHDQKSAIDAILLAQTTAAASRKKP